MALKVELPHNLVEKLTNLPENGMGYQVVSVNLKNGQVLLDRRVVNSTYLIITEDELLTKDDILDVELYKK